MFKQLFDSNGLSRWRWSVLLHLILCHKHAVYKYFTSFSANLNPFWLLYCFNSDCFCQAVLMADHLVAQMCKERFVTKLWSQNEQHTQVHLFASRSNDSYCWTSCRYRVRKKSTNNTESRSVMFRLDTSSFCNCLHQAFGWDFHLVKYCSYL